MKGLWNIQKPHDSLPSPMVESDDEAPTEWSDANVDGADVESAGESSYW